MLCIMFLSLLKMIHCDNIKVFVYCISLFDIVLDNEFVVFVIIYLSFMLSVRTFVVRFEISSRL